MTEDKTIHIPDAPFRPGDSASFVKWDYAPGDLGKPDPETCTSKQTMSHAEGLIRVLGDDDTRSGEWDPDIGDEVLLTGLEHMVRLRIFDERMMKMQGQEAFFLHEVLGRRSSGNRPNYGPAKSGLDFPHISSTWGAVCKSRDMVSMICHCIGNVEDNVKGRQMPVHYTYRDGRYISVSSPVVTQFSQAVGVAMASAYKQLDEVTITWIGDGASAEGDYHYALNFASVYRAPVILNVVNNQWAISTHANLASGSNTFADRGLAYDVPSLRVDGNDFLALYSTTQWARQRASAGKGATHIEVLTYRAGAHSSSDDPDTDLLTSHQLAWGDPIDRLSVISSLLAHGQKKTRSSRGEDRCRGHARLQRSRQIRRFSRWAVSVF